MLRRDAVLMVERSRAPSKGLWSFPAGRREPGEDAETNARRELYEETGLTAGPLVLLGTFTPPGAALELSVFAARTGSAEPRAGDDAAKAEFVPFAEVLAASTDGRARRAGSHVPPCVVRSAAAARRCRAEDYER